MIDSTETILRELGDCRDCAIAQGHPEIEEWEPTAEDLDSIVGAIGRRPTRDEWAAAGLPLVGDRHVEAIR